MVNEWEKMEQAKEDMYFNEKEREALERLAQKKKGAAPLSPVTGKPMEHHATHGIVYDQCVDSKGIWLTTDDLKHLANMATADATRVTGFFSAVLDRK